MYEMIKAVIYLSFKIKYFVHRTSTNNSLILTIDWLPENLSDKVLALNVEKIKRFLDNLRKYTVKLLQ